MTRRVWRYQKGIRIRQSEKNRQHSDQKKKYKSINNDLQNNTHKTKDRETRIPLRTGGKRRCFEIISSSCSTSDIRCVTLVINPMISHEWGKDREVSTISGRYPLSFVTHIFRNGKPIHDGDRKTFEVITST